MRPKWILISCLVVSTLCACGKREVKLDRIMKRTIDTTAAPKIVVLKPKLDSLCDARFDSLVQAAVDSILEVRRLEIKKIIDQ